MSEPLNNFRPRWIGVGDHRTGEIRWGIAFVCPHCVARGIDLRDAQRIAVWFQNPIITSTAVPPNYPPYPGKLRYWKRTGETFETITLSPSIDASVYLKRNDDGTIKKIPWGHWHGFIRDGKIV